MNSISASHRPPRFVLFVILFATGLVVLIPRSARGRGTMAAFDVAAAVFLLAVIAAVRHGAGGQMRADAQTNDANRVVLLARDRA